MQQAYLQKVRYKVSNSNLDMFSHENSFVRLRIRTGLSQVQFSKQAGIAVNTLRRIEEGQGTTAFNAQKAIDTINRLLGTSLTLKDIEGLNVTRK